MPRSGGVAQWLDKAKYGSKLMSCAFLSNTFLCFTIWLGIQRAWSHMSEVISFCKTLEFFTTIWRTFVTGNNLGNSMSCKDGLCVCDYRLQTCWKIELSLGSLTGNLSPARNSFHLGETGQSQLLSPMYMLFIAPQCLTNICVRENISTSLFSPKNFIWTHRCSSSYIGSLSELNIKSLITRSNGSH